MCTKNISSNQDIHRKLLQRVCWLDADFCAGLALSWCQILFQVSTYIFLYNVYNENLLVKIFTRNCWIGFGEIGNIMFVWILGKDAEKKREDKYDLNRGPGGQFCFWPNRRAFICFGCVIIRRKKFDKLCTFYTFLVVWKPIFKISLSLFPPLSAFTEFPPLQWLA